MKFASLCFASDRIKGVRQQREPTLFVCLREGLILQPRLLGLQMLATIHSSQTFYFYVQFPNPFLSSFGMLFMERLP